MLDLDERNGPGFPSCAHECDRHRVRNIKRLNQNVFLRAKAHRIFDQQARQFVEAGEWLTAEGFHQIAADTHPFDPKPLPLLNVWALPVFSLALFGSGACILLDCCKRVALGQYDFHSTDLYQPRTSITLGAFTFGERLTRYANRIFPALAAYNAPQFAVDGWLLSAGDADIDTFAEAIPFTETYPYVQHIYENYQQYLELYGSN